MKGVNMSLKDNLTKLETKSDSFLTRLASSPYTFIILAIAVLVTVIYIALK